jgi:hypothetical protein
MIQFSPLFVIAGLVPATHDRWPAKVFMDGRHEAGHDGLDWLEKLH